MFYCLSKISFNKLALKASETIARKFVSKNPSNILKTKKCWEIKLRRSLFIVELQACGLSMNGFIIMVLVWSNLELSKPEKYVKSWKKVIKLTFLFLWSRLSKTGEVLKFLENTTTNFFNKYFTLIPLLSVKKFLTKMLTVTLGSFLVNYVICTHKYMRFK